MPLPDALKPLLVCPRCKGELDYENANDELVCRACALAYPIRDEIPVMLPSEARRLGEGTPEPVRR